MTLNHRSHLGQRAVIFNHLSTTGPSGHGNVTYAKEATASGERKKRTERKAFQSPRILAVQAREGS